MIDLDESRKAYLKVVGELSERAVLEQRIKHPDPTEEQIAATMKSLPIFSKRVLRAQPRLEESRGGEDAEGDVVHRHVVLAHRGRRLARR